MADKQQWSRLCLVSLDMHMLSPQSDLAFLLWHTDQLSHVLQVHTIPRSPTGLQSQAATSQVATASCRVSIPYG